SSNTKRLHQRNSNWKIYRPISTGPPPFAPAGEPGHRQFEFGPTTKAKGIRGKGRQFMTVKLLLRFDDLCPGINWQSWRKLETIMLDEAVKPILAVVPDNQDPTLNEGQP